MSEFIVMNEFDNWLVPRVEEELKKNEYTSTKVEKPWGFEYLIDKSQAMKFMEENFHLENLLPNILANPKGPKFLLIRNRHRLSWHYHLQRDTYLQCWVGGMNWMVATSMTDNENLPYRAGLDSTVYIPRGMRHRIEAGGDDLWISEISYIDAAESENRTEDHYRLSDDYHRCEN